MGHVFVWMDTINMIIILNCVPIAIILVLNVLILMNVPAVIILNIGLWILLTLPTVSAWTGTMIHPINCAQVVPTTASHAPVL